MFVHEVFRYLKLFTLRHRDTPDGIDALVAMHHRSPGKREAQYHLASDVTELVHGPDAMKSATAVSAILFNEWDPHNVGPEVFDMLAAEIPTTTVARAADLTLVDALTQAGLAKSKSEARRAIEQGGVYVNQRREQDVARKIGPADWLNGGNLLLRKGKKDYALLRVASPG